MKSVPRYRSSVLLDMVPRWTVATILLLTACLANAQSSFEGEFIPFPEVTIHFNDRDVPPLQQHGSTPLVDFFYTAKYNNWRLLTEFLVSDDERDLERLIVGKISGNGRQFWFGRNHSDIDQWNRLFHRETYLQTTIHRPGIIEFEDEGGVLPAHITGFSMEDNLVVGTQGFNYRFTIGLGPGLKDQHLVPFDILKANQGSHDLTLTAIISDQSGGDSFKDSGLFISHAIIPSQAGGIDQNKQTVLGVYTNYGMGSNIVWRGSAFLVADNMELTGGNTKKDTYLYGYLQPEYNANVSWTLYGRLEANSGAEDDLFVQQIPSFISERILAGARYQMENSQAIKFEVSKLKQYGERFVAAEIQWSAAFQ